jgi:hypothetical protein
MRTSRIIALAVLSLVSRAAAAQPVCAPALLDAYLTGPLSGGCTIGNRLLLSGFYIAGTQNVDLTLLGINPVVSSATSMGIELQGSPQNPAAFATSTNPGPDGAAFVIFAFHTQALSGSITGMDDVFRSGWYGLTTADGWEPLATSAIDDYGADVHLVNQRLGYNASPWLTYCTDNYVSVPCGAVVSHTFGTPVGALDPQLQLVADMASTGSPSGGFASATTVAGGAYFSLSAVPEPSTMTLAAGGMLLLGMLASRRRNGAVG